MTLHVSTGKYAFPVDIVTSTLGILANSGPPPPKW